MKTKLKIVKAKKNSDWKYSFPFEVLDKTPGGKSLGRIEWCIEPFIGKKKKEGRYYIEKLWVWAKQTRDKRYLGKIFEIPCFSESIMGDSINRNGFLNHVWLNFPCAEHKGQMQFWAYPQNHHSILEITADSSIAIDIKFK